jgi:nucleoside-diphosphate-sugar epimerase
VAVGSAAEYGPVAEALLPLREDTQARPVSFHGSSKLAQTEQVLAAGMSGADVTVLRTFNLLGPAMPSQLILPSLARRMLAGCGRMLRVANIDSTRDFMDVQDATRILLAVARVPDASGQIVNCCTQRETRVGTLAEMAARHLGLALEIEPDMESPPDPNPRSVGSVQKLFRLVGAWNFKPLEQSVSETLDHMTKS